MTCNHELEWTDCASCDDGYYGHECGEDICVCLKPEENVVCTDCNGNGGFEVCVNCSETVKGDGK